jgi:hypothetical protein
LVPCRDLSARRPRRASLYGVTPPTGAYTLVPHWFADGDDHPATQGRPVFFGSADTIIAACRLTGDTLGQLARH